MSKILVTGGAGFIGSHFIRHVLKNYADYNVVNLDALTYAGNLNNLIDIQDHPNYKFIKGDIRDRKMVERLTNEVDVVVNFAAETHVDRSIQKAGIFMETNVLGTYTLLEAARKYDKKLQQVSTDEVYGSIEEGSSKESDSLKPSSPYSASKAAADMLVHSYFVTYSLEVTITRSTNNYGPNQHPEKMIPLFITNAIQNKHLPIYGDGMNIRDWIYVEDNCEAIDLILHKGKKGEIYNIGAGNEKTNLEVAKIILKELKKPQNLIKFVQDRPGHDYRYSLDCTKIHELGWKATTPFIKGLRKTIQWYVKNK